MLGNKSNNSKNEQIFRINIQFDRVCGVGLFNLLRC